MKRIVFVGCAAVFCAGFVNVGLQAAIGDTSFGPKLEITPPLPAPREIWCDDLPRNKRMFQMCPIPDETDSGFRERYRARVLVLEEPYNKGKEPIESVGRTVAFTPKTQARQSGNFPPELAAAFTHFRGISDRKEWERTQKMGDGPIRSGAVVQQVLPGYRAIRYVTIWEWTGTEERSVGEGRQKRTGTRTVTHHGAAFHGTMYNPTVQSWDYCRDEFRAAPDVEPSSAP